MATTKITVNDVDLFDEFVGSLGKLLSSCKFEIGPNGCSVMVKNDIGTLRCFLKTDAVSSESPVSFCLNDIGKFKKCLATFRTYASPDVPTEFSFDGTFVKGIGRAEFKVKTVKEEVVAMHLTTEIKTKLDFEYGFDLTLACLKEMCSMRFISNDNSPKVYIYVKDGIVQGEIDDKTQNMLDTIKIPLSEKTFGTWDKPIITNIDMLRTWNLIDAEYVRIAKTKQGAILSVGTRKSKNTDRFIGMKIVSSLLKG